MAREPVHSKILKNYTETTNPKGVVTSAQNVQCCSVGSKINCQFESAFAAGTATATDFPQWMLTFSAQPAVFR